MLDLCFYLYSEGTLLAFVLIFVDNILISSKEGSIIVKVKNIFKSAFEICDLGTIKYYLGLKISCSRNGYFSISQSEYINMLKQSGLQDSKPSSVPIEVSYGKSGKERNMLSNNNKYQKKSKSNEEDWL